MSTPILATKLYIPPPRPKVVLRPNLIERLNEGSQRKLTLISAPAGFGKTTLVSEWVAASKRKTVWLSLDEGDNDLSRFLAYLVAALQPLVPKIGEGILALLQSPQPPPTEAIMTALLNEIATVPDNFTLVLDDYHVIDAKAVAAIVTFLLEYLPPPMRLLIATREDPQLPLARWRVRNELMELRVTDLRFTPAEASKFLNQMMRLNLSAEEITALETRTEGWIAGLQLAAISMQGQPDTTSFIKAFTGSHYFVLDYLVEEVLQQQSASVQTFLLRTSILERLCGSLCDAVLCDPSVHGQATLEYIERANLFVVPLDNERRWYRYHQLFADLLRQRLHQSLAATGDATVSVAELHQRASQWYEANDLEIEAFHHATAAHDVERAARLIEGEGMPLHFRGTVTPVLNWLESLPATVLDANPILWTAYASTLLVSGQTTRVEPKLQAAEVALQAAELNDQTRDLIGRIAAIRATLAAGHYKVATIIDQSRRALEYLHPNNLAFRTSTNWKLGFAYQIQGNRVAATQAYNEVIATGQASGNTVFTLLATIGLGGVQETENQLYLAAETYQSVLQMSSDTPLPLTSEAILGLARIFYEWNNLEAAQQYGQQSIQLARQVEKSDRVVVGEVFLARLKLTQGDVAGAVAMLAQAEQFVRQHNFVTRLPDIAAIQVLVLLHQGNLAAARHLAQLPELAITRVRVDLAQGNIATALAALESLRREAEAKGWADEQLRVMLLQTIALYANGEKDKAVQQLSDALSLAAPGGFVRSFVDEGSPMVRLLSEAAARGVMPDYTAKLLQAFEAEQQPNKDKLHISPAQPLIEPLSPRELEILQLIAQGLSNHEISARLFLALDTVKGHNRKIFGKLQVQRRTEAVARAHELGLL